MFRFDWRDLPAVTSDHPRHRRADPRVCLGDFVVSEIPRFPPSGAGEFVYAYVEKREAKHPRPRGRP